MNRRPSQRGRISAETGSSDGWRSPKRRSAEPPSRTRWSSRTDDGIRIEPLCTSAMPDAAPRAAQAIRSAVDRRAAHRRSRSGSAPTGRRWRISPRARPALRWSSRARRTRSATACPPSPEALATCSTACRSTASISASTSIRQAAPWPTGSWRCLTKRRADPAKLSLSFGIDPAAIFAGNGPAAHVDRGAAGVDAAIAGAFLRARRAGRAARRPTAASSTMPARPRRRNSDRDRVGRRRICGCSRRRARRWSMPRRISALR